MAEVPRPPAERSPDASRYPRRAPVSDQSNSHRRAPRTEASCDGDASWLRPSPWRGLAGARGLLAARRSFSSQRSKVCAKFFRIARSRRLNETFHRLAQEVRGFAIGACALGAFRDDAQFGIRNDAPDAHLDWPHASESVCPSEHVVSARDMNRQNVASAAQREIAGAALELLHRAVGRAGAFGKHQNAAARRRVPPARHRAIRVARARDRTESAW